MILGYRNMNRDTIIERRIIVRVRIACRNIIKLSGTQLSVHQHNTGATLLLKTLINETKSNQSSCYLFQTFMRIIHGIRTKCKRKKYCGILSGILIIRLAA